MQPAKLIFESADSGVREAVLHAAAKLKLHVIHGPGDQFSVLSPNAQTTYRFGGETVLHLAGSRSAAPDVFGPFAEYLARATQH